MTTTRTTKAPYMARPVIVAGVHRNNTNPRAPETITIAARNAFAVFLPILMKS